MVNTHLNMSGMALRNTESLLERDAKFSSVFRFFK